MINWTKIKHDMNGNPRYVCHFFDLLTHPEISSSLPLEEKYRIAVNRANRLGGRKFHNKQYGGGIVFQFYNTDDLENHITNLLKKENPNGE